MGGFLLRKVGAALIVLVLASMLVFLGVRAIPGDPAIALGAENRDPALIAAIRHKYLLDGRCPCSTGTGSGSRCTATSASTSGSCRSRTRSSTRHADHARARVPERRWSPSASGIPAGVIAATRRGKPSDYAVTTGRADRALGAALLARAADDHLVRRRPPLAAGERLRLHEPPARQPRAHGDAVHRARRRVRRGADAPDAVVDAQRRSAPTTCAPPARRG